jgi:hypothetical protein
MKFEDVFTRWTEAEMQVATYRLCHPCRACPEVEFLCAQLKAVAGQWYALLIAELARERRRLPKL